MPPGRPTVTMRAVDDGWALVVASGRVEGMSFHDLPADWAERPITDPDLFEDAVDLFASLASRERGCLYLLLCRADGRVNQPMAIDGWQPEASLGAQRAKLDGLMTVLEIVDMRHVVAILARPGGTAPTGHDHRTRDALHAAASAHDVEILEIAIAAPEGVAAWPSHRLERTA